jgi:hypothetical protein
MGEYGLLYEELFEKAKEYTKSNYELLKLKTLERATDVLSTFVSQIVVWALVLGFVLFVSFGLSFWLGDLTGKVFYGFLIVGGFYGLIAIIARFIVYKRMKKRVSDVIIMHALK